MGTGSEKTRVLIVDDDPVTSDIMTRVLTPLGFDVSSTDSKASAFPLAKDILPDVIVLDVMLGDGVGYEVCRLFRKNPQLYRASILFVSSLHEEPEIHHALSQGGDAYLCKPVSPVNITEKIMEMQHLSSQVLTPDAETNMLTREALRAELRHKLFRHEEFGLYCLFIDRLNAYTKMTGAKSRSEVIAQISLLVRKTAKTSGFYDLKFGHFGNGLFFVLTSKEDVARFGNVAGETIRWGITQLDEEWHAGMKTLADSVILKSAVLLQDGQTESNVDTVIAQIGANLDS